MHIQKVWQISWTDKEIDALVQYDMAMPGDKCRSYNREELGNLRVRIIGTMKDEGIYEFPSQHASINQQTLIRIALGIEDELGMRPKRGANRSYLRH